MKVGRVRIAAWAAPVFSFALATVLIVDRHRTFVEAVRRNRRLESEWSRAYTTENTVDDSKQAARFACAERSPKEEAVFFAGLRRHAALADVTIVRLRSQAETLGANAPSGPPPDGKDDGGMITKGVTRIGCQLVLDGSYPALRRFVRGLWESDRLFTMSDVIWNRAPSGTELTLTLNRYLAPKPLSESQSPSEAPNL